MKTCALLNKSVAVLLAIVYSEANLLRSSSSNVVVRVIDRAQLVRIWDVLSTWPGSSTLTAKLCRISLAYLDFAILAVEKVRENVSQRFRSFTFAENIPVLPRLEPYDPM